MTVHSDLSKAAELPRESADPAGALAGAGVI
jgi:hypothetical protein